MALHTKIPTVPFLVAEALMKHAFIAVASRSLIQPSPIVVCHVLEPLEGGLSQIEQRALLEMMSGAGARETFFWEGRELTDPELLSGAYCSAGFRLS
jgi:actin-like ATPase involved in cell morphogenesis